jgi:hypothetical protein
MRAGIYEHYKGKRYLVLGLARHFETHEIHVVYVPLYDIPDHGGVQMAIRPKEMFEGTVQSPLAKSPNATVPRFKYIGAMYDEAHRGGKGDGV